MGRKRLAVCAAALAAVLLAAGAFPRRPFRDLAAADILSASVHLAPPDVTADLDRAEIDALAALLGDAVLYRRDNSYTDYAGQSVRFTLTMADGRTQTVQACAPFLVIDDVGWRTKYAPCAALSTFANGLFQTR